MVNIIKETQNLIGKRFGELKVIAQAEDTFNSKGCRIKRWICECSCGKKNVIVRHYNLTNYKTLSCGCLIARRTKEVCKKFNRYDLSGEYGIGYTSNTNIPFYFDLEDYDKIKEICWYSCHDRQLLGKIPDTHKQVSMHKFLGFPGYDHIDRNEFNNRKSNLRKCTQKQNARNRSIPKNNTSGYIGVRWKPNIDKWQAYITVDGKQINLGFYSIKEDAIRARLISEKKYFQEFAPQRHLFDKYNIT